MKEKRYNEVKGVILVALGLMILASLVRFERLDLPFYTSHPNIPAKNLLGIFGAYLGELIVFLFGRPTSFVLPLLTILLGVKFFRQEKPYLSVPRVVGMFVLLVSISSLIGMFNLSNESYRFYSSGLFGAVLSKFITAYFSRLGGYIIFITFILLSLVLVTEDLLSVMFTSLLNKMKALFSGFIKREKKEKVATIKPKLAPAEKPVVPLVRPKIMDDNAELVSKPKIQIKSKPQAPEVKVKPKELKIGDYHLPSLDLLDSPPPLEVRQIKGDLEESARILQATLEDFGISVNVTDIERGPVITRYELEPAPGVKVSGIVALGDDIALAMKAQSVRIIAPIPGRDRVGIEVPNSQSTLVFLKEVLASASFQDTKSILPIVLGKDIAGKTITAELDDMPHLLIAGTTGSGKTVCINSVILSLLYRNSPNDLKFLMIDPKMAVSYTHLTLPTILRV